MPCKVWVGAADGSLSVCTDVSGSGVLDPANWRILRVEGLTGRVQPADYRRIMCATVCLAETADRARQRAKLSSLHAASREAV